MHEFVVESSSTKCFFKSGGERIEMREMREKNAETETVPETTEATTPRRDSSELPFVIQPIADLVVDVVVPLEVQQEVQAEITRLRQVSVVVHVIGGRPSRGELRHLLQARFQEELSKVVDIQFLGKGCYQVEFLVAEIVLKLLRMGSTRINGIRMHFLQWEPGFDLNAVSEHLSNYFVFSVMFPGLPKEWRPVMPHMASSIGDLIDEESDVMRYMAGNLNLPYIRLIGHKGMTLPAYVRLPGMCQAQPRVQRVKYSGLPNQCFNCNRIGHVIKDCPVRDDQTRQKHSGNNSNGEGWTETRRKYGRKSSMRTYNDIGVTFKKIPNVSHDSLQVKQSDLQIIPFNNHDVQSGREEDYDIVIDNDITVSSMKEKPFKGGNDHEQLITFEPSSVQGKANRELVMTQVEKTEGITSVISLAEGFMNGPHYSGRLTRAKTKALTSHGKNAQGSMLEKSDVQSYTMVINGGGMVDGKSTSSSSLKKDSYAEVVARKPWKGFKIAGQITKPKRATVEEKRMKGKQLLLAYE